MDVVPMTIIVHYGGEWKQKPDLEYVGESCRIFDEIPSGFNVDGMRKIIDSLGYKDIVKLHYCDPCKSIKTGLRFLSYDNATFAKFLSLSIYYKMMDVYTEHHDDEDDGSDKGVVSEGRISMDWLGNDENDEGVLGGGEKDLENELLNNRRQSTMCDDPLTDAEDGSGSDTYSFPESPLKSDTEEGIGNLVDDGSHFFVGQQFEVAKELKKAITNYCVSQGRDVVLTKNGKKKMGAKCRAHDRGCPWWIWASTNSEHGTMVVKTLVPKHICGRIPNVKKLRSKWIAEHHHNNKCLACIKDKKGSTTAHPRGIQTSILDVE
ncbi:putative flagellar filament outer layer-like protein [Bienertia sinuspersici]